MSRGGPEACGLPGQASTAIHGEVPWLLPILRESQQAVQLVLLQRGRQEGWRAVQLMMLQRGQQKGQWVVQQVWNSQRSIVWQCRTCSRWGMRRP